MTCCGVPSKSFATLLSKNCYKILNKPMIKYYKKIYKHIKAEEIE